MESIQDLVSSFKANGSSTAISWKEGGTQKITYEELFNLVGWYGRGFYELGLSQGDRIAIFSKNIPEWSILTLAMNNAGFIDVPRSETSQADEIKYILEHSRAKLAVAEDEELAKRISVHHHVDLMSVITMSRVKGYKSIEDVLALGKKSGKNLPKLDGGHTASIIYTSGSTGQPKGVELSHNNFISNGLAGLRRIDARKDDKFISVLPAWHVFERLVKYVALIIGAETFYTTQRTLLDDFKEQEPTIMASVPRIWEKIYEGVMKKVREKGIISRVIFDMGLSISISSKKIDSGVHPVKIAGNIMNSLLDSKVFSPLREKLGKRFRFGVSGGSKLPGYIDEFFDAAGVLLLEGYGLTETSPVISVREQYKRSLYTVGPLLDNVQAKIIDSETGAELKNGKEGIIYVKGPNVMKGYYRNYEETHKVLDKDGWFDTGDIGYFDGNNRLVISGREKEIIVLSNGENINPLPIEAALTRSECIATAVVVGQDWKHIGALIVPEEDSLAGFCRSSKVKYNGRSILEVLDEPLVIEHFKKEIRKYITLKNGFKTYELLRDFRLIPGPFEIGKELTATLKFRRNKIAEIYGDKILNMEKILDHRAAE